MVLLCNHKVFCSYNVINSSVSLSCKHAPFYFRRILCIAAGYTHSKQHCCAPAYNFYVAAAICCSCVTNWISAVRQACCTYRRLPKDTEGSPSELRHHSISQENGKSHKTVKKQQPTDVVYMCRLLRLVFTAKVCNSTVNCILHLANIQKHTTTA